MKPKHNKSLTNTARMLRKNMTKEEKHLWYDYLRTYPIRFLKQKVIDDYIVDFYCSKARLIIELDGSQHYTEQGIKKDIIRTHCLEDRKLTVLRVPNKQIHNNFEGVCKYIDRIVKEILDERKP